MHGGTIGFDLEASRVQGLSPRARGNPGRGRYRRGIAGTIPACTGEPEDRIYDERRVRDYPRVHGGTALIKAMRILDEGLSPRARGNPKT